ncbi:MAG: SAM-dependent methyltransferase [Pseudonocardiaceae bacterium]|nr:SAM-dependent methyltransferase [Pseudonocardiaceae bacterium]
MNRDAPAFAWEFLCDPPRTASVAPSSAALARTATSPVPGSGDPVVVELGPGTGTITEVIRRRLGGRGRQLAIEVSPRLADRLALRYPDVEVICADATELPAILLDRVLVADVVVSGLPWAAFAGAGSPTLLDQLPGCLGGNGALTQLGYAATRWAPPARRQLDELCRSFEEVTTSRTIWRNLPPAVIHVARRPRRDR